MFRLLALVGGGVLLVSFLFPSNNAAPNDPDLSPSTSHVNTVRSTDIQLGNTKAKFKLDEIVKDGSIDGYDAKVVSGGKTLLSLPVTKSEGKKLYTWAKQHHVFKTLGSLAARAGGYIAGL